VCVEFIGKDADIVWQLALDRLEQWMEVAQTNPPLLTEILQHLKDWRNDTESNMALPWSIKNAL
jgi:hypothetical protein